jgi:tetratricopeptide (TPR) repeat protein
MFFVHYLIEPQKLSIEQYDNDFYSNLEINGSIVDSNDKTIYQFSKKVPIKLQGEQIDKIKNKLFSFQDMFPLMEGKYKLNVLVRNTVSKEFTSIEKDVIIPAVDSPKVSSLTLAHRAKKDPKYKNYDKSYLVGDVQLLPSPRNDFIPGDTLYVFFQLYGLTPAQLEKGHIKYTLYKNDEPFHTVQKNIKDYADPGNILESFSLEGYSAAYYNVRASLYADAGRFLSLSEESFYISPIKHLARPWVVSMSSPANSPEQLQIMGNQYAVVKNNKKALEYLERAYNRNPVSARIALDYCRILHRVKRYQKVLEIGAPFMEREDKNKFYALMGFAAEALGQNEQAIKYYKDYLAYHGTNLRILNSIGACYHKLGDISEALVAWEKSLELFPKQPKLKEAVQALKKNQGEKLPLP